MKNMTASGYSTQWILAITGAIITGFLYLVCCIFSIHKAIKDRRQIIERNCAKRNKKYLKEMGIDSDKPSLQNNKTSFAISKSKNVFEPIVDTTPTNQISDNTVPQVHAPTKAKKINLDNIDEILKESISVNASINSSFTEKGTSETSYSANMPSRREMKSDMPIVTSLRKPVIVESVPKVYYLKAHNSQIRTKGPPTNWIVERLNNESSFANAQRQLQHGLKKAPLAKQNSGFSSMDEDSSASFNY